MKMSKTMRGKSPSKRLNVSSLQQALSNEKQFCYLGKVIENENGGNHWEVEVKDGERIDVLVQVELVPDRIPISARLGSAAGNGGLWRVPDIGDDVIVIMPSGSLQFSPTIVSILSNTQIPSRVGTGRTILVASDSIEIDAPKVYLGNNPNTIVEGTDGLVHGLGIDPFTGSTYAALQSTTNKVFAKKS